MSDTHLGWFGAAFVAVVSSFVVVGCDEGGGEVRVVDADEDERQGGCIQLSNGSQICGGFASTWQYFGTKKNTQSYDESTALAVIGWPITGTFWSNGDTRQRFERLEMNQNGGCPYGSCLSFAGVWDAEKFWGESVQGGLTGDCNRGGLMRRTENCMDASMRHVFDLNGGLEVYGYPISKPMNDVPVWNFGWEERRRVQWFERGKMAHFPQNPAPYQWQGELLGHKQEEAEEEEESCSCRAYGYGGQGTSNAVKAKCGTIGTGWVTVIGTCDCEEACFFADTLANAQNQALIATGQVGANDCETNSIETAPQVCGGQ